jgi:hypothetical protein
MSEIVYRRRCLSWLYYFFVVAVVLLGLLLLVVSLARAVEDVPWSSKYFSVLGFGAAGLSWLMAAPWMWSMGKSYAANVVRLEGSRFSLHTPGGHDIQFVFSDVRQVTWNPGLRSRQCMVDTDAVIYRFDARMCPRIARVAHLIAERSGQMLQIKNS